MSLACEILLLHVFEASNICAALAISLPRWFFFQDHPQNILKIVWYQKDASTPEPLYSQLIWPQTLFVYSLLIVSTATCFVFVFCIFTLILSSLLIQGDSYVDYISETLYTKK